MHLLTSYDIISFFYFSISFFFFFFFFNDTATTEIHTLSLHDALPIWLPYEPARAQPSAGSATACASVHTHVEVPQGSAPIDRPWPNPARCIHPSRAPDADTRGRVRSPASVGLPAVSCAKIHVLCARS